MLLYFKWKYTKSQELSKRLNGACLGVQSNTRQDTWSQSQTTIKKKNKNLILPVKIQGSRQDPIAASKGLFIFQTEIRTVIHRKRNTGQAGTTKKQGARELTADQEHADPHVNMNKHHEPTKTE